MTQRPRETCFFCGEDTEEVLETHHVVPQRFGGTDRPENLVDVCPSCHGKLESLYDRRFYDALAVWRRQACEVSEPRIPDNSAHFWVSIDSEGHRQLTCKECDIAFFDDEAAAGHARDEHDADPRATGHVPTEEQMAGVGSGERGEST